MVMNKDTMDKLASQLIVCQDEQKKLHNENERLQEQLAKLEHQHKIAHANGFEEGYKAAQRDMRLGRQR
jgi:hypothetical protein